MTLSGRPPHDRPPGRLYLGSESSAVTGPCACRASGARAAALQREPPARRCPACFANRLAFGTRAVARRTPETLWAELALTFMRPELTKTYRALRPVRHQRDAAGVVRPVVLGRAVWGAPQGERRGGRGLAHSIQIVVATHNNEPAVPASRSRLVWNQERISWHRAVTCPTEGRSPRGRPGRQLASPPHSRPSMPVPKAASDEAPVGVLGACPASYGSGGVVGLDSSFNALSEGFDRPDAQRPSTS